MFTIILNWNHNIAANDGGCNNIIDYLKFNAHNNHFLFRIIHSFIIIVYYIQIIAEWKSYHCSAKKRKTTKKEFPSYYAIQKSEYHIHIHSNANNSYYNKNKNKTKKEKRIKSFWNYWYAKCRFIWPMKHMMIIIFGIIITWIPLIFYGLLQQQQHFFFSLSQQFNCISIVMY